ncbi:MAG: DUF3857 and transglutaminase domain-containing protein [Candidatus Eremiobacteraeota bacterium]|nr:DUF3857 and transglutaminase domain-containing protein [Candidatus Eremiobacteraeota bacterium]
MMRSIRTLAATLLLAVLLTAAVTAVDFNEILKSAPDGSQFPDANGLILYSEKIYEVKGQKATEDTRYLIKVLNKHGREKYSDQQVPYDTETEQLIFNRGGTYKGDLTFMEIEKKAINDITPAELADATIYSNLLNRVFSFPVVDPGVTLLLDYRKVLDLKENLYVSDRVYFQLDEPLLDKVFTATVPTGTKLSASFVGKREEFASGEKDGTTTYTLKVSKVPQIKREESMPPLPAVAHNMLFTTATSWEEATRPFSGKFFEAAKVTPEVTALAREITGNASSREEKIKAIAIYMAQKVRAVSLPLGDAGYTPHKAAVVIKNKYGDCRDKAVLFISLLEACGVEACPALVNDHFLPLAKDVPTLKQFDSVYVALPRGKEYVLLDPSAEMAQFGYVENRIGAEALVVKAGGTEFTPRRGYSPITDRSENAVSGTLNDRGDFAGTLSSKTSGIYDSSARGTFYHLRGKKLKMYFEQKIEEFCPDAEAASFRSGDALDLSKNMELSVAVNAREFAVIQDNLMILKVPRMPFGFSRIPYSPSLSAREYPYVLGSTSEISYELLLKIPPGYRPLYIPGDIAVSEPYLDISLKCRFNPSSRELSYRREVKFKENQVSPALYPSFKRYLESLDLAQNNLILLKK